jgi:hypothetical protein
MDAKGGVNMMSQTPFKRFEWPKTRNDVKYHCESDRATTKSTYLQHENPLQTSASGLQALDLCRASCPGQSISRQSARNKATNILVDGTFRILITRSQARFTLNVVIS